MRLLVARAEFARSQLGDGCADDDRTGRAQPFGLDAVARCDYGLRGPRIPPSHAFDRDMFFDGNRNAMQQAKHFTCQYRALGPCRLFARALGIDHPESMVFRIERPDPFEEVPGDFDRR